MSGSDFPTVELDPVLYDRLCERVDGSEFEDASAYVEFVLETLFTELDVNTSNDGDDEEVRNRLRELGYLD